ncbi:hypothetical protein IW15_17935 [Chryseobacterium soli]|uniref:Lipoprotein n=2 Tax=Chryseobacterium soli TaxID=445961 RepID=A0A086A2X9_9FLAO|nr:hypothetical protein IW15_17935 [Chryseobacterium soli]
MKYPKLSFILLLLVIISCKQKPATTVGAEKMAKPNKSTKRELLSTTKNNTDKIYEDLVTFLCINTPGDFPIVFVEKDKKILSFFVGDKFPYEADKIPFKRGDLIRIRWKKDTIIPPDGEDSYQSEVLLNAEKIKNGKLTVYKQKHPEKIEIDNQIKEDISKEDLQQIDDVALYFLATSTDNDFLSSIEEAEKADESVGNLMIAISDEFIKNEPYMKIDYNYLYRGQISTLKTIYTDKDCAKIFLLDEKTGSLLPYWQ